MLRKILKTTSLIGVGLFVAFQAARAQTPKAAPPAPVAEYNPASWKTFAPPEGGFSISMPGIPESSISTAETDSGQLVMHLHALSTGLGQYAVAYSDFPGKANNLMFIRGLFAGNRDGILKGDAKPLNENDVGIGAAAGRELIVEQPQAVGRYRWFFIDERLYTLVFITTSDVAFKNGKASSKPSDRTEFYETTCDRFFGSFRFELRPTKHQVEEQSNGLLEPVGVKKDLYPTKADAKKEIEDALKSAAAEKKRVMLIFGGNWCYDCHVLDLALHEGEAGKIMRESFLLVHVDIGEGDKNLDLVEKYKTTLDKGVPTVVILDQTSRVIYSSTNGEFEPARSMLKKDLVAFLNRWNGPGH